MEGWQFAVWFILALILSKVFDYILSKIIKKVDTDYVTTAQCKTCGVNDDMKKFKREMREKLGLISGILLVIASGKEVSQELIERLVAGSGN